MIVESSRTKTKVETKATSFRLSIDVINELHRKAADLRTTPNALVQQVMTKYLQWDLFSSEIGLILVPKELLSGMIKRISIKQLNELVKIMYDSIKDWSVFFKGDYKLHHCLETLEDYLKAAGITSEHRFDEIGHHFVIRHKMGMKWSLFSEELLKKILKDFVELEHIKFIVTPSTTKVTIPMNSDFKDQKLLI